MHAINRDFFSNDWVTLLVILCCILLSFMKLFNAKLLKGYTTAFFTSGFITKRTEDSNKNSFSVFHLLLFIFCTITLSLTICYLYHESLHYKLTNFLLVMLLLSGYFIIRIIIDFLLIRIFNIESITQYFFYTKTGYFYTLCIWLFPVLIICVYYFKNALILYTWLIILFLIYIGLTAFNNKKLILNQLFYFILYLCTLEIAPLLILFKLNY